MGHFAENFNLGKRVLPPCLTILAFFSQYYRRYVLETSTSDA